MNKLILIGNGFDLAHGLPTSYSHFINDFWKNIHLNYKKEEYKKIIFINENYYRILTFLKPTESFKCFEENLVSYQNEYNREIFPYKGNELRIKKDNSRVFYFNNRFFQLINNKNSLQNWVDIENEYYSELKKIVKDFNLKDSPNLKKKAVLKLNIEFSEVKNLLLKYLSEKVLGEFDIEKTATKKEFLGMYKFFKPNSIKNNNPWNTEEFSSKEDDEHIQEIEVFEEKNDEIVSQVYILNFNYTDSSFTYHMENFEDKYAQGGINSIHGEIDSDGFKPVFGFGDEIDDDYKLIENLNDNEYLKYFKSFQYSQNTCYQGLLRFIDSEKFQVNIMGHSCGLSDRVMLNTIFEHENCRSIKVFYHQKENKLDNYTDIIYNISRHFKDKPSMRRKIVTKELSTPLPQNVRFKKKNKES
jgi:hypothetical protein